jgi:uncharacterized protein (TIGR02271 family)
MTSQERHISGKHGDHDRATAREESEAVVELREEELAAHKKQVETGRVSLGTEVVEQQQTLDVPVTREQVVIDRHAVDRRPSDEPIGASSDVVRVPVREDQVSVEKQPVVYEEVNVAKRTVQENQRVSDTVRKEVVDVDGTGDVQVSGDAQNSRR